MTSSDILIVLAIICFAIGALKGLLNQPSLLSRIDWTAAGLAFAVATLLSGI